ncbi:MAG: MBL fold metallo-hydrolase [Vicinamibacterales bacterium]
MRRLLTALVLFVSCATAAAAQGRLGVDFTPSLVPITTGVYVYEGPLPLQGETEVVRTNSLVVLTEAGIVVVDGQDTPEEGRKLIAAIRTVSQAPIRYLINASPHPDHVNSNEVFAAEGAIIVAHENARAAIEAVRARTPDAPVRPTLPQITYRDVMRLDVGGTAIELHYFGLGHTRGDTVVYLPAAKVAFLSELYFNGMFPSLAEGYATEHLATIDRALALDADWWLPGHGYVKGQSQAQLAAGVRRYRASVQAVRDAVARRVAAGESLEQVLAGIDGDLGEFARLPFYGYLKTGCVSGTYRALAGVK